MRRAIGAVLALGVVGLLAGCSGEAIEKNAAEATPAAPALTLCIANSAVGDHSLNYALRASGNQAKPTLAGAVPTGQDPLCVDSMNDTASVTVSYNGNDVVTPPLTQYMLPVAIQATTADGGWEAVASLAELSQTDFQPVCDLSVHDGTHAECQWGHGYSVRLSAEQQSAGSVRLLADFQFSAG